MKVAGILGGLGPETTAEFYLEVLLRYSKFNLTSRPRVLIDSVDMDLATEEKFIKENKSHLEYKRTLTLAARRLEIAGADFIVIPCNSVHIFIEDIRSSVNIPVLSIVEETISELDQSNYSRVGLMATSTTINNSIYDDISSKKDVFYLDENDQETMDGLIIKLVNKRHQKSDIREIKKLVNKFSKDNKLDCVLLACTDLQIVISEARKTEVLDTMVILANATVREILANVSG